MCPWSVNDNVKQKKKKIFSREFDFDNNMKRRIVEFWTSVQYSGEKLGSTVTRQMFTK